MSQIDYNQELTPEVREKMRKNLIYVGIFSIVMLFAGLSSGYIVSSGDSFWVKYNFPPAFYISTVLIILSSIVLSIGVRIAQKGKADILKKIVPLTFILGVGFAYFQFVGYSELFSNGSHVVSKITVAEGRYGTYYELQVNGDYMEVDGNDYLIGGKVISDKKKEEISAFAKQFDRIDTEKNPKIADLNKYTLLYKHQPLSFKDGKFYIQDTVPLTEVDLIRLKQFSVHLKDGRGDFFHRGKFGKDFKVYYKKQELEYKDRTLFYKGVPLSAPLQLKMESASDTATSYLFILTFLHLLHVIVTLIFVLRASIRSFSGKLAEDNFLPVRTLAIFWHFLGVLWVYLLLFLLFIH
ncbi:cytochrome o ubiquinol oxidase subunit III [compost metagenome]